MKKELWLADNKCTGCGACENICPKDVIKVELSSKGHLYPVTYEGCISCGKCEEVCSERLKPLVHNIKQAKVYAAWAKDNDLRFSSTSGGAFTELSKIILSHGGVICGALYDKDCVVAHALAEDMEGLSKLRQSKYVQSSIGIVFRAIKVELKKGREVLFCGAPCQVAALRAYLGKDYPNLYLVDFICFGVNSPKAYNAWLRELESKYNSYVKCVWFKYKVGGWKTSPRRTRIDFENGDSIIQEGNKNRFMCGYLDFSLYLRPSCASCDFKGFPRQGDLTVADFWGADLSIDDDKGTSMVIVNNTKGGKLYKEASRNMVSQERSFDEIFGGNAYISKSANLNSKSQQFLNSLDSMSFETAFKKYAGSYVVKKIHNKLKRIKRWFVCLADK